MRKDNEVINFTKKENNEANFVQVTNEVLLWNAIVCKNFYKAIKILDQKVNVNFCKEYSTNYKISLLHLAIKLADSEKANILIEKLIKKGADVNFVDDNRKLSALHIAVLNDFITKSTFNLLIERGVDLNAVNIHGNTALHYSIEKKSHEIFIYLVKNGANLRLPNNEQITPLDYISNYSAGFDNCTLIMINTAVQQHQVNELYNNLQK